MGICKGVSKRLQYLRRYHFQRKLAIVVVTPIVIVINSSTAEQLTVDLWPRPM